MSGAVVIAISAFRSDTSVVDLLDAIFATPHLEVSGVIVVDSLGTGDISTAATARGWSITYENSDQNLGSAGNLARRMELASRVGADWCLCLNHDANWDADRLSAMLATARSRPRVGAVYPILDHSPREPRWEDGRRCFVPSVGVRHAELPAEKKGPEVLWSSSNGALYSTAPLEEGIKVMDALWMGYEDLAYGIALHQGGWRQLMCRSAILGEIFDYGTRRFLGRELNIPIKPAWYSYYNMRNLIMIRREYGSRGVPLSAIVRKLAQSTMRIIFLEQKKRTRLRMLYGGALAGLVGRSGKGPVP